jgi:hypothetical protein
MNGERIQRSKIRHKQGEWLLLGFGFGEEMNSIIF